MTPQEILTRVQNIIDLTIDSNDFLDYLNEAIQEIADERDWKFLESVDTSQTLSSSDSWTTMKSLPSDFGKMLGIYVDNTEYIEVPYEDRHTYKDTSRTYYIDYVNSQFAFNGNAGASYTVYMYYIKRLTDLSAITDTITLPTRFHRLLQYKVALNYLSYREAEEGNITDKIIARLERRYDKILNDLIQWDAQQQSSSMNYGNIYLPETRDYNDGIIKELS